MDTILGRYSRKITTVIRCNVLHKEKLLKYICIYIYALSFLLSGLRVEKSKERTQKKERVFPPSPL